MTFLLVSRCRNQQATASLIVGHSSIGRSPDATISLPKDWTLLSSFQLSLNLSADGNLSICDGLDGNSSTNGTQLNSSYLSSERWTTLFPGDEIQVGTQIKDAVRFSVVSTASSKNNDLSLNQHNQWNLFGKCLTIGRGADCDVQLTGSSISRLHCVINRVGNDAVLVDQSRNGIFVNDHLVNHQLRLRDNDQIKIGTSIFAWKNFQLIRETSGKSYRIDVRDLWLKGRISGSNLSIEPGQLVAFVGGSGAGKSSLLTTIVGQNLEYQGQILVNGNELRETYGSIKQEIGFVPQDDIVHLDLTVEEVLRYSARLKIPDIDEQRAAVERVLVELEMSHRRKALVRQLSGGQRKRVSIGVELIADPRILFLDEPTSGLDPGLDKRMMELLRSLANSGRTVALVTHATNNVMLCDQVVFLGRGGYLCYAGPPSNCLDHFKLTGDFSDIYQHLERSDQEIVAIADCYRHNCLNILPNVPNRSSLTHSFESKRSGRLGLVIQQFGTLLSRDLTLAFRDSTSLFLNAVTAPLAVLMIAFAANNRQIFSNLDAINIRTYPDALRVLFVIICATIWVGLSTSLQALVKERGIFLRERSFNLLPEAYLGAKIIVMILQALVQSLLILITVTIFFSSPELTFFNWPLSIAIVCFITLVTIGSQALMISSLVKNSQQASSIAPLLLIPQLIFGGVLFVLSDTAENIYPLITSRWAMKAMGIYSDITDLIPGGQAAIDQMPGAGSYAATLNNLNGSFILMASQCIVFLLLTLSSLLFLKHNR